MAGKQRGLVVAAAAEAKRVTDADIGDGYTLQLIDPTIAEEAEPETPPEPEFLGVSIHIARDVTGAIAAQAGGHLRMPDGVAKAATMQIVPDDKLATLLANIAAAVAPHVEAYARKVITGG